MMYYIATRGQPRFCTWNRPRRRHLAVLGVAAIPVIGCDVGTQSIRAAVRDDAGTLLASASIGLPVEYPRPGWAEQDPALWLEGLTTVIQKSVSEAGVQPRSIAAISVAAQVDAIVGLDERRQPTGAAPIWMDRRATTETDAFVAAVGATRIHEITGLNADSSHGAPKIDWLRRNTR